MKKTKIVCTIGPASEKPDVLEKLILNGLNVVRMNFSHGDHAEQFAKVKATRELNAKLGTNVALLLDTKGPEIRLGEFPNGKVLLESGQAFTLTTREVDGNKEIGSISYKGLPGDVVPGNHILIDDGLVDLVIEEVKDGTDLICKVLNAGKIGTKKGVNVPNVSLKIPALTPKDISDIKFAAEHDLDFIAASFIRKTEDVLSIRKILAEEGNTNIRIISKIENQEGLDNFDAILEVSDGIMVARGDLGVEIPMEELPSVQKMMIKKCKAVGKPVITATQMLESMIQNPRPTRAEVSDVANAIYDGTSAIMLSGESAYGDYPVEAVTTMNKIATRTETDVNYWSRFVRTNVEILAKGEEYVPAAGDFDNQVAFSICNNAMFSNAKGILMVANNIKDIAYISGFRPNCPIFVIVNNERLFKSLALEFGAIGVLVKDEADKEILMKKGIEKLLNDNLLAKGDTVVIAGNSSIVKL
ncbi:MAG: pyruvate kinase [Clostridia bacterium]